MAGGAAHGMQTLEQHIRRLLEQGAIASETAAVFGVASDGR
jgi:Tfp pilus assembly pilus retraction ATPase PilT